MSPAVFWEELEAFNCEAVDDSLKLEANEEKRAFFIEMGGERPFLVKAKFHALDEDCCDGQEERLRLRLIKKRGDKTAWYEILNQMREYMSDTLLAPIKHQIETLEVIDGEDGSTASD